MNDDPLWASARNMFTANAELAAFEDALDSLLGSWSRPLDVEIEDTWDDLDDGDCWVVRYGGYSYPVWERQPSGRRARLGTLYFHVSLWREEDELPGDWPGARLAKLYVGFAAKDQEWTAKTMYVGGNGAAPGCEPTGPYLWTHKRFHRTPRASGPRWLFAVRLTALQTRMDLARNVTDPVHRLLSGAPQEEAFLGAEAVLPSGRE